MKETATAAPPREIYMLTTLMKDKLQLHPNKFYSVGEDLTVELAQELLSQRKDSEGNLIGPFAERGDEARARMEKEKAQRKAEQERLARR